MTDLTIVHTSDQHVADPKHDVTEDDGIAHAKRICDRYDPESTIIIDTGDWTGSGWASQFRVARRVAKVYRDHGFDLYSVPANHDVAIQGSTYTRWSRSRCDEFLSDVCGYEDDRWPKIRDHGSIRIILADSCASPTLLARGAVGDDQIGAIGEAAEEWNGPVLLATHHCPSGGDRLLRLTDRRDLGDRLKEVGGVDAWITGHLHQRVEWSGIWGAYYLLTSPMSVKNGCWREIYWNNDLDRFQWEWYD